MKKSFSLIFALLFLLSGSVAQDLKVTGLTCEHKENPVGIGVASPRLSWKIEGTGFSIRQTAYSIRVATDRRFSAAGTVWQSGKTESVESVLQEYNGEDLKSGQRYFWQVKVWDNKGRESRWSESAYWEMGLLSEDDWQAEWIEMESDTMRFSPSPHFRKEFMLEKRIERARVYATSHGLYELHINGEKVGEQVFTPGWTSYGKRIQYQVYDVTHLLRKGDNAIGAVLGDGWYRGTLAWNDNWAVYGKRLGLFLQMEVIYKDGTKDIIVSDGTWKAFNDGAIRMNDLYNGEVYDAGKRLTGWDLAGYDDDGWEKVMVGEYQDNIIASEGSPVKKIFELKPVRIMKAPDGKYIVDMGQNMVGWIRLTFSGPEGTVITVRHAEILDKDGNFYTDNLRSAQCRLVYTLAGEEQEVCEPRFTFMGFRYVEVSGFPGELTADNITGIVVHSDMTVTGGYECSDSLVNQLQYNIQWGQRGNFLDVPTDCPQRDERLGWTGDAQAFCRTAAFNMDVSSFFTKWLKDLSADQKPGGEVPDVIPDVLNRQDAVTAQPSAGWGDVAVIAPWTMYLVYGDKRLLEDQYPSMKAWVEYIRREAGDSYVWSGGSKYGDWLFYHPPVNNHSEPDGHTDHDFIATAFFAYSTALLASAAEELGLDEDVKTYRSLFDNIRKVFIDEYVTKTGRVGTTSQTSYVLALMFDLLPEDLRDQSASYLVDDIRSRNNHLSTGFLGTPYLCHVLSDNGYTDVAYDLLLQDSYPSWLYPVTMGATTIWERWDGQKTDSTFQDAGMNSFNHYAYGAIGDWIYRVSAGIETRDPGYRHLILQPHPTDKLTYSKAYFESAYGLVESGWEREVDNMIISLRIPANTTASVILPVSSVTDVTVNGESLSQSEIFNDIKTGDDTVILEAGSGSYVFKYKE